MGMMALRLSEAGKDKDSSREVLESAYETLERSSRASQANSARCMTRRPSRASCCRSPSGSIRGSLTNTSGEPGDATADAMGDRHPAIGRPIAGRRAAGDDAGPVRPGHRPLARRAARPGAPGRRPAMFVDRGELHVAAAVIDPKWAVALVEAMPDDRRLEDPELQECGPGGRRQPAGPGGRTAVPAPPVFLPAPVGTGHRRHRSL